MSVSKPFAQHNIVKTSAKRIILLGKHRPTFKRMPPAAWRDPDAEVWGLAHQWEILKKVDRVFESHCEAIVNKYSPKHLEMLKKVAGQKPIYTPWRWDKPLGPKHIYIPHTSLSHITDRFESSFAIMLALAIDAAPDTIELYGIDLRAGSEYQYQRPNGMYLIGKAEAAGITVLLPPNSSLFNQSQWKGGLYGSPQDLDTIKYGIKPPADLYHSFMREGPKVAGGPGS